MLFLTENDVQSLLPMEEALRLVREAFVALSEGRASNQPRRRLALASGAALHSMAGAWGGYFGTKVYSTHPRHGFHFHFMLYEESTGRALAMMEANWLGQIRTGAASGVATDLLARPEASTLGIIGSGFQARSQWEAIAAVRSLSEVRVWSRDAERRRRFAGATERAGVKAIAVETAEQAVRGADIVVTATNAKEPVLASDWIADGAHVVAMGSNQARRRELPAELIERAALVAVDSIEQARVESGDLLMAVPPDRWLPPKFVEIAEVAAGHAGRKGARDVTIFKSLGIGVEDVAAGAFVYEQARARGIGREALTETPARAGSTTSW
jgi:alanine dehydrogenase